MSFKICLSVYSKYYNKNIMVNFVINVEILLILNSKTYFVVYLSIIKYLSKQMHHNYVRRIYVFGNFETSNTDIINAVKHVK